MTVYHPSEFVSEELAYADMSQEEFATFVGLNKRHAAEFFDCRKRVDGEMALKIAKFFGTSPQLWLSLQDMWDQYYG